MSRYACSSWWWQRVPFALNSQNVLFRSTDGSTKLLIHPLFVAHELCFSHHAEMAEYVGGRRLYQFPRRSFFWPIMSLACHWVAQSCVSCAKKRVDFRWNSKDMLLFSATAPLELVATDILIQLVLTKRGI